LYRQASVVTYFKEAMVVPIRDVAITSESPARPASPCAPTRRPFAWSASRHPRPPRQRPRRRRSRVSALQSGELRRLARELLRATALAYLVGVGVLLVWAGLLPKALGWRATVVVSGSMEPAVHVGDVLLFDHEDPATLKAGRIILFDDPSRPGQLISHRLYGPGPHGTLITKGDANPSTDSPPLQAA